MPSFNAGFDWKQFKQAISKRDAQLNPGKSVPKDSDIGHIWVQFFDRRGYAGYFSVPSTFGHLQQLGAFASLPKLGRPNINERKVLKEIMDLTKPIRNVSNANSGSCDHLDLAVRNSGISLSRF